MLSAPATPIFGRSDFVEEEEEEGRGGGGSDWGLMRSGFYFLLGTAWGVYMAQNYNVPNIKRLLNTGIVIARAIEQSNRKSKRDDGDDG